MSKIAKKENLIQLVEYGIIGILGFLVDLGIFYFVQRLEVLPIEVVNIISSSIALIHNYLWNSYVTFKVYDRFWLRLVGYFLVGQITTLFTTICLWIFVTILHQDKYAVKIISMIVAVLLQFLINKKVTFKRKGIS
ncbi:GtrA family protein [Lactobacillus gigeriorum]|uniref:GtrA family membrane protein n=1 Tax=Lactobacillus gigeriorum DSM 23908 = CRBIP 24.85 TaxID=1423751 RepID=I7KPE2_9LACO|nr:GtrA family protein [Lactobacillus gigeriorum]KRN14829.1 hypothetical protein FC38_GL000123 [Lactobacillus gigeriorum DSM 23908 = CRBIP 24.85]CCI87294.1 GtrA family membrane protein [Lactobacillus gigeriorum DSM 23908 = CRBIP 24.85]